MRERVLRHHSRSIGLSSESSYASHHAVPDCHYVDGGRSGRMRSDRTLPQPAPRSAGSATFDRRTCGTDGIVSARNGETYIVELIAYNRPVDDPSLPGRKGQVLGPLAPGHSDTLYDVRPEMITVAALPDSMHGECDPWYQPRNVQFSCVREAASRK